MRRVHREDALTALVVSLVFLAVFVVLLSAAMVVHPGGSWADPQAQGFEPFVNYWCDLMRSTAMNGEPNALGAALATAAFCTLAGSLAAFWRGTSPLVRNVRVRRATHASGAVSCVSIVAMACLRYDGYRIEHTIASLAAGGLGSVAAGLLLVASWRAPTLARAYRPAGVALGIAALANIVIYTGILVRGGGDSCTLPVVQKVATVFLVVWMVTTVRAVRLLRATAPG